MKLSTIRSYAMSLPEVTEEPHHNFGSFRVRGKIFLTVPPGEEHIHIFVPEFEREKALVLYPEFTEKLTWAGKVVGLRVSLSQAISVVVKQLVLQAWRGKAPRAIQGAASGPAE